MSKHLNDLQFIYFFLTLVWVGLYYGLYKVYYKSSIFHKFILTHSLAIVVAYSIVSFLIEDVSIFYKVLFTIVVPLSNALEKPISYYFKKEGESERLALIISSSDWIVFVFFIAGYVILFPW